MKYSTYPLISVVVPVYNRAFMIGKVLESLLAQNYPNFEIVCVDDGSTDDTADIIKHYPQVKYIYQENSGPTKARQTGIDNAAGEIIHFIDSDVIAPRDLLSIHAEYHIHRRNLIVQGQLVRIMDLDDAFKTKFSIWAYSRSFFDTANVSVRKEHILKVGGFDWMRFRKGWEDLDIGLRLLKLGLRVKRLVRRGYVWHYEGELQPVNIRKFFKDRFGEGRAAVLFYRKHPTFAVKHMTMIHPFYIDFLDHLLFKESYLLSDRFYENIQRLWVQGKKDKAIAKMRLNAYHFYFNGIRDKIREDGYILKVDERRSRFLERILSSTPPSYGSESE